MDTTHLRLPDLTSALGIENNAESAAAADVRDVGLTRVGPSLGPSPFSGVRTVPLSSSSAAD